MPFHAAGGLVTAMLTSSTPAAHAAFNASRPPIPPEGTYSGARRSLATRSRRKRSASSHSAPPERTITAIPADSSASTCSRTASCEAASITISGRAEISACTPVTKGTPNSRASALPREVSLRPATATTSTSLPRFSRKRRAMTPPPRSPTRTLGDLRLALEQAVAHLLDVHDESLVGAVRHGVGAGGDRRLEGHAAALELDQLHRHGDAFAE